MRIGFMLSGDLSIRTGGFLYDRQVIKALGEQGVQIEVLELPWRSYGVSLISVPRRQILGWCENFGFDMLIQDELAHPLLFRLNRTLHQRHKVPIITLVHHLRSSEAHPAALNFFYREIERAYLSTADGAIVNSGATRASVQALIDHELPLCVALPGRGHLKTRLTEDEIRERSRRADRFEVIYLGSVEPRKGLLDLVGALAEVDLPEIHLTVIGRDSVSSGYVRKVKNLIAQNGLWPRTRWMGEVDDSALAEALADADVLALPSSHEGFGISYLDAMGFGVVPVGTTAGGADAIIRTGENGFLLEPTDRVALAACLHMLAQNRELLGQMGVQAFRDFQAHPTWEQTAKGIYEYLKEEFVRV